LTLWWEAGPQLSRIVFRLEADEAAEYLQVCECRPNALVCGTAMFGGRIWAWLVIAGCSYFNTW
jgi:hypothetical protein